MLRTFEFVEYMLLYLLFYVGFDHENYTLMFFALLLFWN